MLPRRLTTGSRRGCDAGGGTLIVQTIGWYRNRLMSMSPGEIAWRVSNLLRDKVDRALLPVRQKKLAAHIGDVRHSREESIAETLLIRPRSESDVIENNVESLLAEAREIMLHRVRLFGHRTIDVGTPIRWNYEHNKGIATPTGYAGDIDYRDYDATGDCKWAWELNRHHQLVVLGRAYRATGDESFANEILAQIDAWIDACPFGTGMNWRSPLELAIRVINWTIALELIADSDAIDADARRRIDQSVYQHLWDITRKYSRYSSANNHLIGEAAGVYVAACAFDHLPGAARWRSQSQRILIEQMSQQVDADGVHRELATGYHLFVLQFFLLAYVAGTRRGEVFPDEFATRLEAMFDFLAALDEGGSLTPRFGDCDDGYVVDLGGERGAAGPWLNVGARLFGRADFERSSGSSLEAAALLLGRSDSDVKSAVECQPLPNGRVSDSHGSDRSRCFSEAGIYLLQSSDADGVSVTVDCGPLGFKSIAAHGHADALSVTLRAFGVGFLIDPGTYDYFSYPEWRDYFRTTKAHNTIEVDGFDQSEMLGKFLWGKRAESRCIDWKSNDEGSQFVGEHDGYARLDDPVTHRRSVILDRVNRRVQICDELQASGAHRAALHFHFAPECVVEQIDGRTIRASRAEGRIDIELPETMQVELVRGATAPILGWCSDAYHEKQPITTLRATCEFNGSITLESSVQISRADSDS